MLAGLPLSELSHIQLFEVVGRVDGDNARQLGEALIQALADGRTHLILDLSGVSYLSSVGLREIVRILGQVKRQNGKLRIANPSEPVRHVLELVGLDFLIEADANLLLSPLGHSPFQLPAAQRQVCYFA
jgi:anti-sigma B factor antagonist